MRDMLLFTLDDLGDRQGYVLAIFAIVLFSVACVLLCDAYAWFESLGAEALEAESDEALSDSDLAEGDVEGANVASATTPAPAFQPLAAHPAFGRKAA